MRLEGGTTAPVTTDADGQYHLSDIAGQVEVTVTADPSYLEQTAEVTVDSDRTPDFVLEHTGEPPYPGTVWVNPDILGPAGPTSLGSVTYMGRGMREVFDRRVNVWVTVDAYLFEAQFGERMVEFQVNPEFGSTEAARTQVDLFASSGSTRSTIRRFSVAGFWISCRAFLKISPSIPPCLESSVRMRR